MKWIVWIPMLDGDERTLAIDDQALVQVGSQFWDGDKKLGRAIVAGAGRQAVRGAPPRFALNVASAHAERARHANGLGNASYPSAPGMPAAPSPEYAE